ncbi:terminase large subunit domain-containing protein [Spartinivicinus ruber]|uniref:terminase large subunit domain-containing protein n=1 Tax=Spartinivicinus ruber TaxID=2683272 RepID=UPI0013D2B88F|nr:terminase family protein [Spartinivicinus ruber]
MKYSDDLKQQAKQLYLQRHKVPEIAKQLGIASKRIIYYWAAQEGWTDLIQSETAESALARRLIILSVREAKTDRELNEMDRLVSQLAKLQKNKACAELSQTALADNSLPSHRSDKPRKKRKSIKNDISSLTAQDFEEKFVSQLFDYQRALREVKSNRQLNRIRNILKSRQIGLTYYFAGEAFEDAVLTGDNQIFLSASRSQAEVFRSYITQFAKTWFDIELKGDPIVLSNGAELRFVSTNASTAQSYHGHVYTDEYFWIPKFKKINSVASGMAMQKDWRKTYFSTPSAMGHEAYPFWMGEAFKKQNKDIEFPSQAELSEGALCPDGQYRQIITIEDAITGGCDLFDLDQLRLEYSEDEFNNLLMCQFIDDKQSVFKLNELEQCCSDRTLWLDFEPHHSRPFGDKTVWIGFDPSRTQDAATCVVMAPPDPEYGDRFRVLEKHQWYNADFSYQAQQIKALTQRFNVQYIGIDITGIGRGVYELVKGFFPNTQAIHYSVDSKNQLVLKGLDVVRKNRIAWDIEMTDIPHAFLTIKQTTTPSGQMTYSANRTQETGHADVAFAILHALFNEPINTEYQQTSTWAFED